MSALFLYNTLFIYRMKLIKVENYSLSISDEALLVKPIRKLWNQDRSEKKERFYQQMSFLYFFTDPRSSYAYMLDDEERKQAIVEQEGLEPDFQPSPLLKEAMEVYKKHTITPSQRLLENALISADKVGQFLRDVDLTEKDDKGKPLYQVSAITAALKNVEGIVTSLQNIQRKVEQEISEQGKARGTQELSVGDIWAEQGI